MTDEDNAPKSEGSGSGGESRGPLSTVKRRPTAPKPENDFQCAPKYFCQPPEPKMDLKLLEYEPDLSFYSKFRTTVLDLKHKRPLYTDSAQGVRVNLADLNEYVEYGEGEGPNEEDALLLDSDGDGGDSSVRRRSSSSAPFLRSMFYDEYKVDRIDYGGSMKKSPKVRKRSREELVRDVTAGFHMMKRKPMHPNSRKKDLEPVDIQPVFPDFRNYVNRYVVVQFEDDPSESIDAACEKNLNRRDKVAKDVAKEMISTAVTTGRKGDDNEPCLSLYVPVDDEIDKRKRRRSEQEASSLPDRYGTSDREEYQLVKEYGFDVRSRDTAPEVQKLYLLSVHPKRVTYCEVSSRLALHLRARQQRRDAEDATQARRLVLKRRALGASDQQEKISAITELCHGDESLEMANALEQ